MPCALDGSSQTALMLGTRASLAPASDLASVGQRAAQCGQVLVINSLGLFQAKGADFAAPGEAAPSALRTTTPVISPG